jgi:hypothetical protein
MTTPIVQTLTDELLGEIEAAANDVRGWTMREYFQEPDAFEAQQDWEWYVGAIDEDGNQYPLLNVNARQYDSDDSEKLARYYALVNRDNVLAMITELLTLRAENAELRKDAERYRWRVKELDLMFGRYLLAMKSAVIDSEQRDAEEGMRWIYNSLEGPGELPPEEEIDAQAFFDREIKPIDDAMREIFECTKYQRTAMEQPK